MIRHPADAHVGHRHEPQHRQDGDEIKSKSHQCVAAPGFAPHPEKNECSNDEQPREKLVGFRRVRLPLRVDRQQRERPKNLRQVKQQRHPGYSQSRIKPADRNRFIADSAVQLEVKSDQSQ